MSLKKIEIRYFPPGISIKTDENGKTSSAELNTYALSNNLKE